MEHEETAHGRALNKIKKVKGPKSFKKTNIGNNVGKWAERITNLLPK